MEAALETKMLEDDLHLDEDERQILQTENESLQRELESLVDKARYAMESVCSILQ